MRHAISGWMWQNPTHRAAEAESSNTEILQKEHGEDLSHISEDTPVLASYSTWSEVRTDEEPKKVH